LKKPLRGAVLVDYMQIKEAKSQRDDVLWKIKNLTLDLKAVASHINIKR
jgi:hypothetical protein